MLERMHTIDCLPEINSSSGQYFSFVGRRSLAIKILGQACIKYFYKWAPSCKVLYTKKVSPETLSFVTVLENEP